MTAAVKLRVTAIKCPSCNGTGRFSCVPPMDKIACQWCKGGKTITPETAKKYADLIHCLAGGGFVAGDHSYDDMKRMEAKAEEVYQLIREVPSWKREPVESGEKP